MNRPDALPVACGAEMRLVRVEPDASMLVSGYEHHAWHCSGYGEDERRMVFTRLRNRPHLLRRTRAGYP